MTWIGFYKGQHLPLLWANNETLISVQTNLIHINDVKKYFSWIDIWFHNRFFAKIWKNHDSIAKKKQFEVEVTNIFSLFWSFWFWCTKPFINIQTKELLSNYVQNLRLLFPLNSFKFVFFIHSKIYIIIHRNIKQPLC